ncbi:MAG: aminopeptidase P family protein [Bacteroidales bacterium]|nr:aminopeptidase P family protein [Bacteroidales bacterium]
MVQDVHRSRLAAVRALMKKRGIDALIVPSADPHLGEYVPDHWRVIRWLTGFTGSAGTVVITSRFAGLWTDSRYFIQAAGQLRETGFELVRLKIPHTPEYIDWLAEKMKGGSLVSVDGRLVSASIASLLRGRLKEQGIRLSLRSDLITPVWHDRPPLPDEEAFTLPLEFAGESRNDKIYRVRERMKAMDVDYQLLTSCDDVMWLLNIRGRDITYSPLLLSFAIVRRDQVVLFADEGKIPGIMKAELDRDGVVLLPYEITASVLRSLPGGSRLLLSPSTTSATLRGAVPGTIRVIHDLSIPTRLKAIRNETEIKNLREVMIRDGVALTRFFIWLEKSLGREKITELSASARLEALRMEQEGCTGPSFATIAAFNEHAALPHYVPGPDSDAVLEPSGIFLLDSGGQYYGGTTDITRTVALGQPDDEMRKHFTLALRGTIDLAMARFPHGTRGYQLELLARKALWDNGLNYGHGTGHGVGSFLNVHEGPQTIGSAATGDLKTVIEPGMVTSDEPAVYLEGKYGFRTENLILCVSDRESDYGKFLRFETVTLCYIDRALTDLSLLDEMELQWLNEYHETVYNMLADRLEPEERDWLGRKTAPLIR